jgi:DNA-binding XRE family transcriptional regulator
MTSQRKTIDWRPVLEGNDLAYYELVKKAFLDGDSVVKVLRVELDLSQADLARLLGTTQSNVSKIEARGDPRLSTLRKIVEGKGGRLRLVADFGSGREVQIAA